MGGEESGASPLVHLRLDPPPASPADYDAGDLLLQRVVQDHPAVLRLVGVMQRLLR